MPSRRRPWLVVAVIACGAVSVLASRDAPATIEEQRARLPPASTCDDPIEGGWQALEFYPRQAEWYLFLLRVRRNGDTLAGDIAVVGWTGDPHDPKRPTECTQGLEHWSVHEPATGSLHGAQIELGGTSWAIDHIFCGAGPGHYIVDKFIGTVDDKLHEFQSVNRYPMNGMMVEDVTVFRRVQCFDRDGARRRTELGPILPPGTSPLKRSGCGR